MEVTAGGGWTVGVDRRNCALSTLTRLGGVFRSTKMRCFKYNTRKGFAEGVGQDDNENAICHPEQQIDNVFYEARGQRVGLVHLLRAIEVDFARSGDDERPPSVCGRSFRELEAPRSGYGAQ
ncbi:hypothetical protein FQR65_LT17971 [Abscondita terminalis]|nr:hypothetical protein FQR65_LT17971 [Abscondita terminalis]